MLNMLPVIEAPRPITNPIVLFRLSDASDAEAIARLFRQSSGGVANYIWSGLQADYPGLSLLEIGTKRFARRGETFSYQNCHTALYRHQPIGIMHAYPIGPDIDQIPDDVDSVLKPYALLEEPNSLYISAISVEADFQGFGIGKRFLHIAETQALKSHLTKLSLLCFEANHPAVTFYKAHGFVEAARQTIVPHDMIDYRGDALLMVKTL